MVLNGRMSMLHRWSVGMLTLGKLVHGDLLVHVGRHGASPACCIWHCPTAGEMRCARYCRGTAFGEPMPPICRSR